jgi:hypothetical protein
MSCVYQLNHWLLNQQELQMLFDPNSQNHNVLTGRYFISFKEKDGHQIAHSQGQVIEKISDKYYLVRVFNGPVRTEGGQYVITLEEMLGWQFYDNDEGLRESYKCSYERPK